MIGLPSDEEILHLNAEIKRNYPYDFSNYALASLARRIQRFMVLKNVNSMESLLKKLLNSSDLFDEYVEEITVNTTEMFRDPEFWYALRTEIIPKLQGLELIRIWHAGCSSGQEVLSMLILLNEMDLLGKVKIVASDISREILAKAKSGIIGKKEFKINEENYRKFGGKYELQNYFKLNNNNDFVFDSSLFENVTFKKHDLVLSGVFSKFDLILCRNVMIYFNKKLQDEVYELFARSLFKNGYLAIGRKETMVYSPAYERFEEILASERIYQIKKSISLLDNTEDA